MNSNEILNNKKNFLLFFVFSFLNNEKSRKNKEFVQLMKMNIQQENEELSLNNQEPVELTNDDYDQFAQLPVNNSSTRYNYFSFSK